MVKTKGEIYTITHNLLLNDLLYTIHELQNMYSIFKYYIFL